MADPKPTWGFSAGRPFNHYKCEHCGAYTISKDLADGVTPFLISCKATQHCHGMAASTFYRGPQVPEQQPHIVWYRPTPEELDAELAKYDKDYTRNEVYDHVNNGGLLMRVEMPPTQKLPWGTRPRQA